MLLTLCVSSTIAQYKYDHNMVLGYWSEFDGYKDPILEFNTDTLQVKYEKHGIPMDIGSTNISEKDVSLYFYRT